MQQRLEVPGLTLLLTLLATTLPRTPRRSRDHRGASTASVGSCDARSPLTATCAGATSGAPRRDLAHGLVYARHNCVAQRRFAPPVDTHVNPLATGLRSRKRHGACVRSAACTPRGRSRVPGVPPAVTREDLGGCGMRTRVRQFTRVAAALLAVLLTVSEANAVSLGRQCRRACADEIAACVAGGSRRLACRRQMLGRCRTEGLGVCQGSEAPAVIAEIGRASCRERV